MPYMLCSSKIYSIRLDFGYRRMRRIIPLGALICCLLSQVKSQCDPNKDGIKTDKKFPDIFTQSVNGYELSAEFANTKTNETVFVNEYFSTAGKDGKLEIFRNKDYKQFFYFHNSDETFTISGFTCETGTLTSPPPFLEDLPHRWLDYEDEYTLLGPSATIRQGYLAWKGDKNKVIYVGDAAIDRGMKLDRWRQCVNNRIIDYYFSKPTWHNAFDFPDMAIPVKVEIATGTVKETIEFFSYQPYFNFPDVTFDIPGGYGCNRTVRNEMDVPELGGRDHFLQGEMVYYAIDMDKKKYSRFISVFRIAYHHRSDMLSYLNSPWKKGAKGGDELVQADALTQTVWDNRNSYQYVLNQDERKCSLNRDPEFTPNFDLPGEDEGKINLLDPRILISTEDFKYLGQRNERGIPVQIFESVVQPTFLLDAGPAVGIITRAYATEAAIINTGNQEVESPVRITIQWYEDEEKTKLQGVLIANIFSYTNDVPSIQQYFDVRMCFPDYDASTWFKITFPNRGVSRPSLVALSKKIRSEFLGVIYTESETTPIRIPRVLVDVTDDDFSVEAMVLERPPIAMDFDNRGNFELENSDSSIGMVSQDECLQGCIDYFDNNGSACRTVSYCGASCYMSTGKKAAAKANKDCALYDRVVIAQSLPSMDRLVRDIRKLVVTDSFSLTFPAPVGDMEQAVTFPASSFGDSVGDTRGRLVPRLLTNEEFKLSYVGMKLVPAKDDQSKTVGKVSLSACMRICLNDPYCETLSYCRGTACVVSKQHANKISIDRMTKDTKCVILGRNYLQQFNKLPGISLTRNADNLLEAENPDVCAKECTNQNKFDCQSFDFCESKRQCLLHSTHYLDLKEQGSGIEISVNCSHYSRLYVYDYKMIPNQRVVGDTQLTLQHNSVEDCAKECRENGGFNCTAFDFCEGVESIDNKCILISTPSDKIKLQERNDCRHYVYKGPKETGSKEEDKPKRYSNGLAGGLGFLFFIIGSVLGIGGTYLFGYMRANRG